MDDDEIDAWSTANDAVCVSFTDAATPDEVLDALPHDVLVPLPGKEPADVWASESARYDRAWLAVGTAGAHTFLWEQNGWAARHGRVPNRLSQHGSFTCLYWNVNLKMEFLHARDGVIVRSFDPFWGDEPQDDVSRGAPLAEEVGLRWEARPKVAGLRLVGRLTTGEPPSPALLELPGTRFFGHHF